MIQRKKKKKRKKEAGKQLVILANGYPGYSSTQKEIKRAKAGTWFPNTPDFIETAADTQKSYFGAGKVDP